MLERFEIQSITEGEVVAAFTLKRPAFVRAAVRAGGEEGVYESAECERVGRVFLEGLRSDTEYGVSFSAGGTELAVCQVRTLPSPRGEKGFEFAVIADPHITMHRETRCGRLFMEAEAILRRTIAEVNRWQADFVLLPGDVTNWGYADECALARGLLDELTCPALVVSGDHDTQEGRAFFRETFGSGLWVERRNGLTLIGCEETGHGDDAGSGCLGERGIEHILAALESAEGQVVLVSHKQLLPDDYVVDANRVYADHERFAEEVLPRLPAGTLAYVGHKNVPALYRRGNLAQLNCPQPVQYPCGVLRVRGYENGMFHTLVPMFSEILNDFSRVTGNALGNPLWEESYRRGHGPEAWNFVWAGV